MAAASVADIYDSIKHANGQYCCVCFRLSDERKLVTPVFILRLSRFCRKSNIEKSAVKVCYLCEAMAGKVFRFQQAVHLAATVEAVLAWMTDEIRGALTCPGKYASVEMTKSVNRVKKADYDLQNTKMLQLACSTVLLVGSDMPANVHSTPLDDTSQIGTNPVTNPIDTSVASTGPVNTNPIGTNVGTSAGTSSNTTAPVGTSVGTSTNDTRPVGTSSNGTGPAVTNSVSSSSVTKPKFNNEPIVVEDDPPPKLAPPVSALKEKEKGFVKVANDTRQLQLQVTEPATGSIILHPIMIGSDGKMYVPSLKVEVVNNEVLKSVSDKDLFQYANVPLPVKKPVAKKKITQNVAVSKPENLTMIDNYYDFIKQQAMDKEEIQNGNTELNNAVDSISNKRARLEMENPASDQDGRVGEMSTQDGRVGEISSQDGRSGGIQNGAGSVRKPATYAGKVPTKPVLRMDKVLDWEDKIPMDVISFMDATDPNPLERIMQPNPPPAPVMGVISDVRTIDDTEENEFITSDNHKPNGITMNSDDVNTVNDGNSFSNDEDIDNDVLLIENIECIDLC